MFSLRTLLVAIAIVAVGIGGLITQNVWWAGAIALFAWLSVAGATLAAIASPQQSRWSCRLRKWGRHVPADNRKPVYAAFSGSLIPDDAEIGTYASTQYWVSAASPAVQHYVTQLKSFFVTGHSLSAFFFGSLARCRPVI